MNDFDLMNAEALRVETIDRLVRDKENLESELKRVLSKLRKLAPHRTDLKLLIFTLPKPLRADYPPAAILKLRVPVEAGLFSDGALGSVVANFNRTWRRLLGDLNLVESDPKRIAAEDALVKLGVTYVKIGNNGKKFFTF